jgi:hypothetical protein
MEAVKEEAESVSTERFTRPVRTFACKRNTPVVPLYCLLKQIIILLKVHIPVPQIRHLYYGITDSLLRISLELFLPEGMSQACFD